MAVGEQGRVCIVGCGRWMRRDDQIGLKIARRVAEAHSPNTRVIETESPTVDVAAHLDGDTQLLVLVDAARKAPGHPPGSWQRIDFRRERERLAASAPPLDTHSLSVDAALALAEEMRLLPPEVWIYVVAVENVEQGEAMSSSLLDVTEQLTEHIIEDIEAWFCSKGNGAGSG
ncbi:MAG: hydrogenase maturation protease [Planctomycetota bacterium]